MKAIKDLAEEYALKEYARANGANDLIFEDNMCFTFDDIKEAFNVGRESVVENMPELEWREVFYKGRSYFAAYSLGLSYKIEIEFVYNEFKIFCNYNYIAQSLSLSEAKQAANIHYKQRIKKALGL